MKRSIYVGWDPREQMAWSVAMGSISRHLRDFVPTHGLYLGHLIERGLYKRPTEWREGPGQRRVMWDVISDAPMATEHANARFLIKELAKEGWALFIDGDVLVRADISSLFDGLDPSKAVYCVKHDYAPNPGVKMDGQVQTTYPKKLWSSVMAINCDHPANQCLTVDLINSRPGRELHAFCWLKDEDIGALEPEWNYLVGVSKAADNPKIVHFTLGLPDMSGYENCEYAEEWRREVGRWAA